MLDCYIYDGLRTPFGRHAGALATVRPDDMIADLFRAVVARNAFDPAGIDDVSVGCGSQAGEDGRCIGRNAVLLSGLPINVPGNGVQRNCGGGMNAIISGAHAITCGEADLFLAGGVESMSRAPFVINKAASPYARTMEIFDTSIGPRFPNPRLEAEHGAHSMPETADELAREHAIGREDCDAFALLSQQRYAASLAAGFFDAEIEPVTPRGRRKDGGTVVAADEHPRPNTTAGSLAALAPINRGGVTTAGNASGVNDGAAALLLGSRRAGEAAGTAPRARILASGVAGVEPRIMGYGPVPASRIALRRAGITVDQLDVIEINEAFAAQVIACAKGLGISAEDPRLNPGGGAIAIGHPLGASGVRIVLTAMRRLEQTGGRYALATMCIGLGQGIALVIERV